MFWEARSGEQLMGSWMNIAFRLVVPMPAAPGPAKHELIRERDDPAVLFRCADEKVRPDTGNLGDFHAMIAIGNVLQCRPLTGFKPERLGLA